MATPEAELADFVSSLAYEDVPGGVRETVRRAFLDTVGVTLAGAVDGAGETAFATDGIDPATASLSTVLGFETGPSAERALRVGTAGHALDYDDLSWAMDGHPSVTLVPTIFALAPETDASGADLLTAYAAGFEVECALAGPISPDHYEAGWHATATFGAFGATAAAASLLDLDAGETEHALNVAASTPAGLKRNFGSMTKPLHAGLCSRSGVTAARLAARGFTADSQAVSGDRGFWDRYGPAVRGDFDFDPDEWALAESGIHVKYYPCCYFTHSPIAATAALCRDSDVAPREIEGISVRASQGAADALHHADPETGLEGKFSMEYTVASAAARERVGLGAFEEAALSDPDVQFVRERVDFTVDDALDYDSHEAIVRIETEDSEFERRQENPPGTHGDPLSEAELREKFRECAERTVSTDVAGSLADALLSLDSHEDAVTALTP